MARKSPIQNMVDRTKNVILGEATMPKHEAPPMKLTKNSGYAGKKIKGGK